MKPVPFPLSNCAICSAPRPHGVRIRVPRELDTITPPPTMTISDFEARLAAAREVRGMRVPACAPCADLLQGEERAARSAGQLVRHAAAATAAEIPTPPPEPAKKAPRAPARAPRARAPASPRRRVLGERLCTCGKRVEIILGAAGSTWAEHDKRGTRKRCRRSGKRAPDPRGIERTIRRLAELAAQRAHAAPATTSRTRGSSSSSRSR